MAKLSSKPITWSHPGSYHDVLAANINDYWRLKAAYTQGGTIRSDMVNGVPKVYRETRHFKHPDVVWFYRDSKGELRTR
jgi:hypothetical protein